VKKSSKDETDLSFSRLSHDGKENKRRSDRKNIFLYVRAEKVISQRIFCKPDDKVGQTFLSVKGMLHQNPLTEQEMV
jgi:hypothetical protein